MICSILLAVPISNAAANLAVTAFSCNPNEVVNNNQFSCTATIQNTGDATGSLNTATLYPDASNWLESANYPETVNTNINSGASTEVVCNNLKPKKSGDNGFSKIILDDVTDTYISDNGITVNVIDVVVVVTSSTDSITSGSSLDLTAQAIAGGNVDITITFSVSSGDYTIGSQASSVTINSMTDGQTTSNTWTVTIGDTSCSYAISAQANSNPTGTASKTDTTTGTITCTDCVSDDGSSDGGSSGGAGGAGGSNATTTTTPESATTTIPGATTSTMPTTTVPPITGDEIIQALMDYGPYILAIAVVIIIILGYLYYHGHKRFLWEKPKPIHE